MQALLLATVATFSSLPCSPAEPQARGKIAPPPGLLLVEGGTTRIGSKVDYVEQIAKANPDLLQWIAGETPQHEVRVDDFFLMVTEVTNEQYAAFVESTGSRPPELWGAQAIDEASRAYLEELEVRIRAAKDLKQPLPERVPFDRSTWWRHNWQGKTWALPKGKETSPVVYVDYRDARAYARWAGLRLMSEFEYQRAGRGKTDNLYPWGNETDSLRAATQEARRNEVQPVASRPLGATVNGIYDLTGNAWEWTSSPFVQYPGWKVIEVTVGAGKQERKVPGLVDWDPNQRVAVGGCFQTNLFVGRLTTRRASDRSQSTDGLGFRCAATFAPGRDIASAVMDDDLPADKRPATAEFDATKVLAADRWQSKPGTATTVVKNDKGEESRIPVPGYSIITGYDYFLFVPAVEVDAVSVKGLQDLSRAQGVVHLGVLSTTRPVMDPELKPGTYLVAYRGAGAPPVVEASDKGGEKKPEGGDGKGQGIAQDPPQEPAKEPEAVVQIKVPPGYDFATDNLIFYDTSGEPVSWMVAPDLDYARPAEPVVLIADGTRVTRTKDEKTGKIVMHSEPATIATLKLNTWVRVSNKGFAYSLQLKFKPGEIATDWRHP